MPAASVALPLDQQICFALYSASRALTSRYREFLAPLGLTYPQYLVMTVLWARGASTVSELSDALHLDSGTLSPLLKRLESAGLLTRSRRADDERSVRVDLTDDGDRMRDDAASIPARVCAATGLDLSTLQALTAQLGGVAEHVRATA